MALKVPRTKPPAAGVAKRLRRLFEMRDMLTDVPGLDRGNLAGIYGVSERQIQADLAVLRAAGVRVERWQRGYRVRPETQPQPPATE